MNRRIINLILVVSLVFAIFTGCSGGKEKEPADANTSTQTTGTQETETSGNGEWEPATISVYTWLSSESAWGAKTKNDIKCFQELEKRTNTKVEWSIMSDTNSFDLMMSSGETTDVIWYLWSTARQIKYADAGLIMDIYPLVKEHAPNIMKLMESNPRFKQQVVTPEGKMYLIPYVTEDPILTRDEGGGIRRDWLNKLGLSIPETTDELYNALKQFREKDVNENGQNDEIITGYPSQIYKLIYGFGTAFAVHLADDGKTVVYGPITENYKNALKWLARLYKEGILDPDYLSWDGDLYTKKVMENRVGLYIDNVVVFSQFMNDAKAAGMTFDYAPLKYLKYNGKSVSYNSTAKRIAQPYGSCISTKAKNPERIIKWLDYMYSEEGAMLMNWGIENESYVIKNGKPEYTDAVLNDPEYEPGIAQFKYAEPTWCGPKSAEATLALLDDIGKEFLSAWADVDASNAFEPLIYYSATEQEIMTQYSTDINTEAESWRDKFITGEKDIDAEWDNYISTLKGLGLEKFIEVQQSAYDRFMSSK